MHCYCLTKGKTIEKQIGEAIVHYEVHFGHKPKKVFVNPLKKFDIQNLSGIIVEFTDKMKPPNLFGLGDEFPELRKPKLEAIDENSGL
jgi:hypothetical protein